MGRTRTSNQSEERLLSQRQPGKSLPYLLFRPDQESSDHSPPLLLFLHGAGERGRKLSAVKRHGPPKIIETDAEFPFLTISPQCPDGRWWQEAEMLRLVEELLDEILSQHPADPERVYLTGISMGGFGTWALAAEHPEKFAAIVPICGGGDPKQAGRFLDLPIWAFHGERDSIVPLEYSQVMVDAIRRAGGNVKFTVYPDVGHDSWTRTYENPALYQWLLEQQRQRSRLTKRNQLNQEILMSNHNPKSRPREQDPASKEPGRTPNRAEGDDFDVEGINGPQAVEQECCREEPKRTPGKAEG